MTQPDLLLFSILNLAKNYINGLKKKKNQSLAFWVSCGSGFLLWCTECVTRITAALKQPCRPPWQKAQLPCPSFLPTQSLPVPPEWVSAATSQLPGCGSDPCAHSHRLEYRLEHQACVSLMEYFHTKRGVGLMRKTLSLRLKAQIIISHVFSSHGDTIFSQLSSIIRIWDFPRIVFTLGFK